jgi:hypothetical protein
MAVCPKCHGEMGQTQAVCPHCGYDFPPPPEPRKVPWWVYLGLLAVWIALLILFPDSLVVNVVSAISLLALGISLYFGVWRVLRGD